MSTGERTISMGTVIGIGFIILGVLSLFATMKYHHVKLMTSSRIPGILFIITGSIIIIINAVKKNKSE